ncbi:hypothetical protein E2C01_057776 [Portunus trituberculatus]|uniref:Uncharacterized protein n=1 Tax=Portunus trituberculatus TaxID=210409 RepID=A0A5B7H218_PORTR|nr:hypothetical protein [Portunus trituberculatus]
MKLAEKYFSLACLVMVANTITEVAAAGHPSPLEGAVSAVCRPESCHQWRWQKIGWIFRATASPALPHLAHSPPPICLAILVTSISLLMLYLSRFLFPICLVPCTPFGSNAVKSARRDLDMKGGGESRCLSATRRRSAPRQTLKKEEKEEADEEEQEEEE